ncbi:G surface protein, allelic form 156-like isoform X1 [Physella acuta]|uniref:G surface protein, allelic form 156-like isoform X1 n=1 Tax=Physella acuta TaxID=109671 RepID=UPI0027DE7C6E|nr:G surface protein, allelic form 156-like isoform X1 [Physella acuta]
MPPYKTAILFLLATWWTGGFSAPLDGSCVEGGVTYQNGEIFICPNSSGCVKKRCDNGVISIVEEGCSRDGVCIAVSANYTSSTCRTYTCVKTTGSDGIVTYAVQLLNTKCRDSNGVCFTPGERFTLVNNGTTYPSCTCSVTSDGTASYTCSSTSTQQSTGSCSYNGVTYQSGQTIVITTCIQKLCQNGVITTSQDGCSFNGACLAVDTTTEVSCTSYRCSKTPQADGTTIYAVKVVSSRCKDANGACHNPGESFPLVIGGKSYSNCTCTIAADGSTSYSCSSTSQQTSSSCLYNGATYQNGDIITINSCNKRRCDNGTATTIQEGCLFDTGCITVGGSAEKDCRTYTCSKSVQADGSVLYSVNPSSTRCKDANGACYNPGERFALVISGTSYSNCTCSVAADGTASYSCSSSSQQSSQTSSSSCLYNGVTYQNGDTITVNACIKRRCDNGVATSLTEGCQLSSGSCVPVDGSTETDCQTYTCTKAAQADGSILYSLKFVSRRCKDANGACHNPGESFPLVIGGKSYSNCTCTIAADGSTSYSCSSTSQQSSSTCSYNGVTYQTGDLITVNSCIQKRCDNGSTSFVSEGCPLNNACVPVDGQVDYNCKTYTCVKAVQPDTSVLYSTKVISTRCKDANGACYNPGERFALVISGTSYSSCTCSVAADGTASYSCASPAATTCTVGGVTYQSGATFNTSACIQQKCDNGVVSTLTEGCSYNGACISVNGEYITSCRSYTCTKTLQSNNSNLYSVKLVSTQCKDANGACHNPGENFPLVIGGHSYSTCTCTIAPDGAVSYKCSSGHQPSAGSCVVSGVTYPNGAVMNFTTCMQERCENGVITTLHEACPYNGHCIPVDGEYTDNCRKYTCTKTVQPDNTSHYAVKLLSSQCKDANNVCHDPGELFPLVISGTTYNKCTCTIAADDMVSYNCSP